MMKTTIYALALIAFLTPLHVLAQCTVDAGKNKAMCMDMDKKVFLDGEVNGGMPPYAIVWEAEYQPFSKRYYAASLLSDTTVLGPEVKPEGLNGDIITFKVEVTDSLGQKCTDSVAVVYSAFITSTGSPVQEIQAGETTKIFNRLEQGIPPYSYHWQPNYNISDTSAENPMVWPDTDTTYWLTVTDSIGCQNEKTSSHWDIYVTPTALEENALSHLVNVHPNPVQADGMLRVGTDHHFMGMQVLDAQGRMVWERDGFVKELDMSTFQTGQGVHFLVLTDRDGQKAVEPFVVE